MLKELTAAQITNDALLILKNRGVRAERRNNHATRGRRNNVKKGRPDIDGRVKATGVTVYCEVKKVGDYLSPDQIKFMLDAIADHCICLIATQGDRNDTVLIDFIEYLNK
jgi:hypothetical protein